MVKNNHSVKFIVLEGLDGAGKSTQAALIADDLRKSGKEVFLTQEPGQSAPGKLARSYLSGARNCSPDCLQLLFAADRACHLEKEIIPHLRADDIVISDRYFLSSLAYGAVGSHLDWLWSINKNFLFPDLTIYLDVSPQVYARRIARNGKSIEMFEDVEILEIVRQNYNKAIAMLSNSMKIVLTDGDRAKEEVFADIINEINLKLKNQN